MNARQVNTYLAIAAIAVIFLGIFMFGLVTFNYSSEGPLEEGKIVLIKPGQGVSQIATVLRSENVISSKFFFKLSYFLFHRTDMLQAGEYVFLAEVSPATIIKKMRDGDVFDRKITIPEGWTSAKIKALLLDTPTLSGETPEETPKEGSLLPETYHYVLGDDRNALLARMQVDQDAFLKDLWIKKDPDLPIHSMQEAIILASIIEKETGVNDERGKVAGVFINRLNLGMRLQSDPTVIYALTKGEKELERSLSKADLEIASPYNTYKNAGLPPAPICNPGKESLRAALNPTKTTALYFVADGKGGHIFSNTLDAHNRNVRKYRIELRKQKRALAQEAARASKSSTNAGKSAPAAP
jgi:UPF0755 protein